MKMRKNWVLAILFGFGLSLVGAMGFEMIMAFASSPGVVYLLAMLLVAMAGLWVLIIQFTKE